MINNIKIYHIKRKSLNSLYNKLRADTFQSHQIVKLKSQGYIYSTIKNKLQIIIKQVDIDTMQLGLFGPMTEFDSVKLKVKQGQIPKEIKGTMFRNGPGRLNYGTNVAYHLFVGDGAILKLAFSDGECMASMRYVNTPVHRQREQTNSFEAGWFKTAWRMWKNPEANENKSNTSVLLLKNSPNFLAVAESFLPVVMKKQTLQTIGPNDFGWIKSNFSAHAKVDPDNGDIYNVGIKLPQLHVMKMDKSMKLIKNISFKMKHPQSIHDFSLAGDYLVIFEHGIEFSSPKFFKTFRYLDSINYNTDLPSTIYVYSKDSFELVTQIQVPSFWNYHFTNGYSIGNKIIIQFCRYDKEAAFEVMALMRYLPQYTQLKQGDEIKAFKGQGILTRMEIVLDEETNKWSAEIFDENAFGEFPLCEDHEIGKEWDITYMLTNTPDSLFYYDQITRYNRKTKQSIAHKEERAYFNQPAIARCGDKVYLISAVNRPNEKRSSVQIFDGQNLKKVCQLEFPQYVPPGFHCRWQNTE